MSAVYVYWLKGMMSLFLILAIFVAQTWALNESTRRGKLLRTNEEREKWLKSHENIMRYVTLFRIPQGILGLSACVWFAMWIVAMFRGIK